MLRNRLILLLLAAVLVVILFNLPQVVVDNTENGMPAVSPDTQVNPETNPEELHNRTVSGEDQIRIQNFKAYLAKEENPEKSSIFADSLAELYLEYQKFDSAATYFEKAAQLNPSPERWMEAGNAYYEAFTYAIDTEDADFFGRKVRECLGPILSESPERLDLKTKIGMTLVSSSNPMEGIVMLREVLEEDPENAEALYNLGILAFQTGQYESAIERFENLIKVEDTNVQAHFYLGICFKEVGETEKAKKQFEKVKELDKSADVHATVDSYLEEMN